jgi:phosphoribosyl-AMP cyclohydrolase
MISAAGKLKMDAQGLFPAVLQDAQTGQVLMLGFMNQLALQRTLQTGQVHFWSRSRNQLWRKGETSGNIHEVVALSVDCDGDALLVQVRPAGPTCHTGQVSCFHIPLDAAEVLHDAG